MSTAGHVPSQRHGAPTMITPLLDRPRPFGAEVIAVSKVFLHVTRACNLRCDYCYPVCRRAHRRRDDAEDYTRLWPELVALDPRKVILTGGEPLLRPDLFDLLRGLRDADPDHRVLRCLNTNGYLATPELARQLVDWPTRSG